MKSALITLWRDFWSERNAREKMLCITLGLVFSIALLYSVLWMPARSGSTRLMAKLPAMERELAQMQEQARQAQELGRRPANITPIGDGLRDTLMTSLAQHNMTNAQLSVLNGAVQIKLTNVFFADWLGWLNEIRKQYKLQIAEAQLTSLNEDGQVDLTALLQAPSAR
ncbi:type II secretion system protein GspM [Mycoavidus sp. B2-EB]|uniref:type II secretion system protein GspM n=1 Tax=Mycoavidus sp. B2-EB TaxID=2651972 RepID=UPI0016270AD7|nr:type II secretion system protein M [Mycoavidus sp. B2-EB]BBO58956.1 general secretory pathway protein GspM [Mycoavidus sp. B2-EB]